ncbi:MAG: lysylphosphatidylglycerol synthase domain-containing protein [Bacteroidota bacterium]
MKGKRIFNILLFVSFVFLFIYLVRQDYIIPEIHNLTALVGSVLCLFAGFYASAFSWFVALRSHRVRHTLRETLVSHGQSIFAKYIPGKIWVILGRAGYLSEDKTGLKNRSFVSFMEQAVYLWAGFLISAVPTLIFYGLHWFSILLLGIFLGLTLFLFVEKIHHAVVGLLQRVFKREIDVPLVRLRQAVPMVGAVLLIWSFWTIGFYLFMLAFSAEITPVMMFAFPLSVCFGLIAIILPAGLGVREGIIIGYLTLAGLDVETATTISFVNRLWFIAGEVFIFLLATAFRLKKKKKAQF